MPVAPSRSRKKFLADYDLDNDYLVSPNGNLGRPGLLRGRNPEGLNVLVKLWPSERLAGLDLEQIWRSEIRQLQRLAAVPRADELFVPMLASGEDKDGFYLVLSPGQGSPLETFRQAKSKPTILAQPTAPRNRRRLWSNIYRVAEALELLHSQGIIHRNIDPWSIVTSFDDRPDFRLTGFEWSMRIATVDGGNSKRRRGAGQDPMASFGRDWSNLGLVVSELVGAPIDRVANLRLVPSEIAEHLSASEGQVLRSMLQLQTAERLDGELLCQRIRDVVTAITAQAAGKEARLELALRLGTGSRLSTAIRRASENEIEIADKASQLAFVADDLSQEPLCLSEVKSVHSDGVGRRELASLRCTRRLGRVAALVHPCSMTGVFGSDCSRSRNIAADGEDATRQTQ
jgi:serine/threonine protein kinase